MLELSFDMDIDKYWSLFQKKEIPLMSCLNTTKMSPKISIVMAGENEISTVQKSKFRRKKVSLVNNETCRSSIQSGKV